MNHLLVLGSAFSFLALAACTSTPPPAPPPAPSPAASGAAASTAFEAPPTGEYEVTTETVSDTCSADAGTPAFGTTTLLVVVRTSKGKTLANIPLVAVRGQAVRARMDLFLDPIDSGSHPNRPFGDKCAYEVGMIDKPTEVTRDTIKITSARSYGDDTGCPVKQPVSTKCKTEHVHTYKLVKKLCDAQCTAKVKVGPATSSPPEVTCECP